MARLVEWAYNRENYVINRHAWLRMYMQLCNQEIKARKKKKHGRNSKFN